MEIVLSGVMTALFTFVFSIAFTHDAFAQSRAIKFLPLYVGVYHDEIIDKASNISLSGTFRKNDLAQVQFNQASKVLRFYPRKAGLGTVVVKDKNSGQLLYEFRIDVRQTSLVKIAREIRGLTADITGIAIKVINDKVVIDGQILLPRDMKRIHTVVKQYGNMASSIVTLSPIAQKKISQLIERDINNPEVRVRAVNDKFILEGVVDSVDQKKQAEIIAKAYVPDVVVDEAVADKKVLERRSDVVINLLTIRDSPPLPPKKIIQLVVHYVELSKDYNKGFRFQWTPDVGDGSSITFNSGSNAPNSVIATITGTISNLLPKLNWAKSHGLARVLQSSSIIVEDSEKGTLTSTTRVPYQSVSKEGQPITEFENTGITASITPQLLSARSDSVKLKMSFEVSALIGITQTGPLTSHRTIQSVVVIRSGQSAAVGGLISNSQSRDFNRLPPNASTNPIFSLYASKTFIKNQSQFVVFVTPMIKASASTGTNKIKRKFRLRD